MKKALIVASVWPFLGFEKNDMKLLKEMGYEIHCATDFNVKSGLDIDFTNIIKHQIDFSRSPFSSKTFVAFGQLKKLLKKEHFDIIHCHTPVASILVRNAAKKYRKKGTSVIYTSHGFHFYKGGSKLSWLFYYPAEKICSLFTDVIITINEEDYNLANSKLCCKNVFHIPGVGIDNTKFNVNKGERDIYRKELGISEDDIMILSVGEVNENKNHQLVIRSLAELKNSHIQYFIAGEGSQKKKNIELAEKLNLGEKVHFLGFRSDIKELNAASDLFAFPSIREGLGLAAIEALSMGKPVVGMHTRGISEYVKENYTGFLFSNNPSECALAINQCINMLRRGIDFEKNCRLMAEKYDVKNSEEIMRNIYSLCNTRNIKL